MEKKVKNWLRLNMYQALDRKANTVYEIDPLCLDSLVIKNYKSGIVFAKRMVVKLDNVDNFDLQFKNVEMLYGKD